MLDPYFVVVALVSSAFAYALFRLYRKTQVELLRQRLYEVRDSMFDEAVILGKVSREDPAYQLMRNYVNSIIRFAHRFYIADFVVLLASKNRRSIGIDDTPSIATLLESSRDRDYYLAIHRKVNTLVLLHMVKVSPLISLLLVGSALGVIVAVIARYAIRHAFSGARESFADDPTVVEAAQSQSVTDVTRYAAAEGMALLH